MISELKLVHTCEYCKKYYINRYFAEKHETACPKNPDNFRPCFGCRHLKKESVEIVEDSYRERISVKQVFYCSKIESYLYPPKVEHKGNSFELDGNVPMPRTCEYKQPNYLFEDIE
jgi:hypothetical protein